MDDAVQLKHPFDLYHAVPDELLKVVFDVLTLGPAVIARRRAATLKRWITMARDLEGSEKALKSRMESGVESILRPKRVAIHRRIS